MIELLARIPYFRRKIIAQAFSLKYANKPRGFESLKFVFRDRDGHSWYTWRDDFEMYVKRKLEIDTKLIELSAMLSKQEIQGIVKAMKEALNAQPIDLATVAFLVEEMNKRNEMLVHEGIMYDLLALHYIRDDENPAEVDTDIHDEKVRYLRESRDMSFFFDNQPLNELFPFLKDFGKNLRLLMNDSATEVQALKEWTDLYISQHGRTAKESGSGS